MSVHQLLRDVFHATLDIVLPPACAGCGQKLEVLSGPFCSACEPSVIEAPPSVPPPGLTTTRSVLLYGGQVAVAVRRLKYRGASHLAHPLGILMSDLSHEVSIDVAVPVPLHPRRLRARGYNQAALLGRAALGGQRPFRCGWLTRQRDTPAQTNLKLSQRWANVRGAFVASPRVAGLRVLVVDDVATTGATGSACAEALLDRGASEVHLLTLARAMP